jgi:hypothetical protein
MSLTVDTIALDDDAWSIALPSATADDCLWTLWGVRAGTSSPRSRFAVHPACHASAPWLQALWAVT